jgi:Flp pilus assembly pilin Flp
MAGFLKDKTGQQIAEYAILIALVLAAIIGMKIYVQRGLQASYQAAVHRTGDELKRLKPRANFTLQYELYYIKQESETQTESTVLENQLSPLPIKSQVTRAINENTNRQTNQEVLPGAYGD